MKRLSICLLAFSSLFFTQSSRACGFHAEPGEYRFSIFQPLIAPQVALSPFYFSSYYNYRGNIPEAETVHYDDNVQEWYTYLKGKVSKDAIYEAQYEIDPQDVLVPDSTAQQNAFITLLRRKQYRKEWAYFKLAKQVEASSTFDPWSNELDEPRDAAAIDKLIAEGEKQYRSTRSAFLQYRIAYQLIRLCMFNRLEEEGNRVYEKMFLPVVPAQSWIKGAGTFYWALLCEKSNPNLSYYRLSLAIDGFSNKRSACLRRIPMLGIDSVLPYAATPHQRAVILSTRAMQFPGKSLDDLREIYRLDPQNADMDFMLIREVNKLEDMLKTPEYTDYEFAPAITDSWFQVSGLEEYLSIKGDIRNQHKLDVAYAGAVHAFIDTLIAGRKAPQTNLHLCAAQIALMLNHTEEAKKHLDAVQLQKDLLPTQRLQWQTGQYLMRMLASKQFDTQSENFLMQVLEQPDSTIPVIDGYTFKQQLILMTARTMLNNKDSVRGMLMLAQTDRGIGLNPVTGYKTFFLYLQEHGSPVIYDGLIAILEKKNKTKLETYLTSRLTRYPYSVYVDDDRRTGPADDWTKNWIEAQRWTVARLLNYKATWYFNADNLDSAKAIFAKVPAAFWMNEPFTTCLTGDPLYPANARPYDPEMIMPRSKVKSMTKPEFVNQLWLLKQQFAHAQPANQALLCMNIGAMYYQASYFGEYWLMSKSYWSSADGASERSALNDRYYGASLAKEWYLKAMQLAKNQKQASVAAMMARHCDMLYYFYTQQFDPARNPDVEMVYEETIGEKLHRQFKRAPYYDMMLDACK